MSGLQNEKRNLHQILWWALIPLVSSVAFLAVLWFGSNTYYAGLFGGREWIVAVAKNQVPQSQRAVSMEAKADLVSIAGSIGGIESTIRFDREIVFSIASDGKVTRYGTLGFPEEEKVLALPQDAANGIITIDGVVYELSEVTVDGTRFVRIVKDSRKLLEEIESVSAVEVMLLDAENGDVIQHTWRGIDETPTNLEISKETIAARDLVGDDQEWMTDVELSSPYSGYYLLKLGRGAESIRTFYAYATVPPVEGFDTVVVLVMVPDTVMLKYPRRSIAGGIALLTLMVVMVMSMIHRLSARHINPLVDLATRVERLRDKISVSEAERGEQLTELREDAPNHEVASLEQVVGSLEMEIERGKELERKVTNLEKLEAVGRLAGGIAHDFNNLLNVMSLNVAHIRGERGISEQTRNSIEMMSGAINAGAELTRKLTHFRHGGMTRDGGQPVVEAGETIDATLGLLRQLIGDDIELLMELPKSPVFCGLSSTDLQQVVLNLVLNARDAVGVDGEITLRLSQDKLTTADQKNAEEGASGESMELSVEDNGCGMSQEEIDKVFEPFYTTKRDQGGTGFGMAGVYGIVNSAGGSIHIESSEGVGTKIIIRIPLAAPVEAQDPAHKISADVTAGRNIAGMTCLLVEDEASSLISLRKILLREGVNSLVASNGVEARDILAARRDEIDMVISDVAMPMLDGIALAEGIGENHPGLPIILVSGHFLDIEETRAQVPSVAAFIQKPINSEDLCARISEALSMSRKA